MRLFLSKLKDYADSNYSKVELVKVIDMIDYDILKKEDTPKVLVGGVGNYILDAIDSVDSFLDDQKEKRIILETFKGLLVVKESVNFGKEHFDDNLKKEVDKLT